MTEKFIFTFIFGYESAGESDELPHWQRDLVPMQLNGVRCFQPAIPAMDYNLKKCFDRAPLFNGFLFNCSELLKIEKGMFNITNSILSVFPGM